MAKKRESSTESKRPADEREASASLSGEIDLLSVVTARVRLLLQRRIAWLMHLHERVGTNGSGSTAALQLLIDQADDVDAEREYYAANADLRQLEVSLARHEALLKGALGERRQRLLESLELTETELDLLDVCVAFCIEPGIGRAMALLHGSDACAYPSEQAVARLMQRSMPLCTESGAIHRWELVTLGQVGPGEQQPLLLDPYVLAWLSGRAGEDPHLVGLSSMVMPLSPLADWPIESTVSRITRALELGQALRVTVTGPDNSGRRSFAANLAQSLGYPAFGIDTSGIADADWPKIFMRAQRHAILNEVLPIWHGDQVQRRMPIAAGVVPVAFVTGNADLTLTPQRGLVDLRVALPSLSKETRLACLRRTAPHSQAWPVEQVEQLMSQFPLDIGDLVTLGRFGSTTLNETREHCRALRRGRLGELGQQLDCPFERADLTLPERLDRAVDDLLFEARASAAFWARPEAQRLFPRGRGLVVLMSGPPGTGKTMTAQVIARELGLDLVRIDLATTVSKYIGETAKNLKKIFERASDMHAVLLFDEADALFTKRTEVKDAHDRYANADTNYLLQLLEAYPGIAILASNRRQNIDTGFTRRIRYVLDFPKPSAAERSRIWKRLVSELFGPSEAERLDRVLSGLAAKVELSGAQIKLAILNGAFSTQRDDAPLSLQHLLNGVDRELGKEARGISPAEQGQLTHYIERGAR